MLNPFRSAPDTLAEEAGLIVHSRTPFNAEPPVGRLRDAYLTPQRDFYVRCHGDIPQLDPASHRLQVGGRVATPLDLSLEDLRTRFPVRTVTASLQCAGNRRSDMRRVRPVSGDPWAPGAIGNAEWTGVSLADLLRGAGADADPSLHVAFTAADDCRAGGRAFRYAVSIPMPKALAPEVLIAWAMNGEVLASEHGAPLRAVVPGYAGVRSAKWLQAVTVQVAPADSPIQATDYMLFPPDVTKETADPAKGLVINELPLNSAICHPAPHARLPAGPATLRGYATAAARAVARVDVSTDGGRSWRQAVLEHNPGSPWGWTFWHAEVDLLAGDRELAVRAWDSAGQTQPALPDDVWNHRGYLCTAWHRVPVTVT